jgi:hypothetical protein
MREYNYDDEDKNDIDKFWHGDDNDDDEMEEYELSKSDIISAMEIDLMEKEVDLKILKSSLKMLEKSFWWRFCSFETKLKRIAKTYLIFKKLTKKVEEE